MKTLKKNFTKEVAGFIFFTLLSTSSGLAFTLTSPNIKGYPNGKVTFQLNPANCPSDIKTEINEAIDFWNAIPIGLLDLSLGSDTTTDVATAITLNFPEQVVITCSTNFSADSGLDGNGTIAAGLSNSSNGRLNKGYIIVNMESSTTAYYQNADATTKKIVITHEMGHVLGLGHTAEEAAIMYFSVGSKTALNFHQDDIDGITYLYEQDELGGDIPLGCGMVSNLPPPPWWLFFLFLLPFIVLLSLKKQSLESVKAQVSSPTK